MGGVDRAADRVERFLEDHPDGDLLICVGYASAWGVAWLARRCRGRRVRLLIGETRQQFGWGACSAGRPGRLFGVPALRQRAGPQLVPHRQVPSRPGVGAPQGVDGPPRLTSVGGAERLGEPHPQRAPNQRGGDDRGARPGPNGSLGESQPAVGPGMATRRHSHRIPGAAELWTALCSAFCPFIAWADSCRSKLSIGAGSCRRAAEQAPAHPRNRGRDRGGMLARNRRCPRLSSDRTEPAN